MEYIKSKVYGEIPSPSDFNELMKLIELHNGNRINVYFWRGQSNINWPIHSAAYRRLKLDCDPVTEKEMFKYEYNLLRKARHQGYGYIDGREITDFELLARLQHHGAATRLIDFSRNMLVSLWFACKSNPRTYGNLFGIHTENVGGLEGISINDSYEQVLKKPIFVKDTYPQSWQPPVVTKRIASQSAHFLYSSVKRHSMGSLAFEKNKKSYLVVALSPEFKKRMILLLEGTFDIWQLTMFPDIDGFGIAHSEHVSPTLSDRW